MDDCNGVVVEDGFLHATGGGGGFDVPGKGGGFFDMSEFGCEFKVGPYLRRFANGAFDGCSCSDSEERAFGFKAVRAAERGLSVFEPGGLILEEREESVSELNEESRPVSMPPPPFLNLGIPVARNIPAN